MKHVLSTAVLAVSITLALAACGNKSAEPAKDAAAPASKADAHAEEAEQALTGKLNSYIDCYNDVDSGIHQGIGYYTSWMKDPKAGPTGREERPIGPPDLDADDLKTCDAAIPTAIAAAPALPELDKAAKAYLDSLHTLQPLTHAAYDYYKREDFEDDGYARGKAMHAPLMDALAAFVQASGVFSTALEAENDRAQQAQLQALEKQEGRTRTYYRLAIMMEAKSLMDLMAEDDFDVVQGRARLDAFNTIADEAHAKVADQEPGKMDWNSFETAAENFRREGKERIKRVAEKTAYTDFEQRMLDSPSHAPQGSAGRLLNEYNSLVFQSNRQ